MKTLRRSVPNRWDTESALSSLLQDLSQGRFPRFPGHFGRRPDPGARTRRATRVRRIDRTTPDGLPAWKECAVSLRRPAASVYSRLAGYEDLNDAERLSQDPPFRLIGSEKIWDRGATLTSRLQTFETEVLAEEENCAGLGRLNRALIGKAETMDSCYRTVLDMDSTEVPVYGEQEQSAYNGYFESTCFHPLLLFNREGASLASPIYAFGNLHLGKPNQQPAMRTAERTS